MVRSRFLPRGKQGQVAVPAVPCSSFVLFGAPIPLVVCSAEASHNHVRRGLPQVQRAHGRVRCVLRQVCDRVVEFLGACAPQMFVGQPATGATRGCGRWGARTGRVSFDLEPTSPALPPLSSSVLTFTHVHPPSPRCAQAAPMSLFVPVSPGTPATAQPPAQSTPAPQQSSFSSEPSPVPKKKRVMGKGGRPLMNRGPGRPKSGGIHIPDDELYKYHLGLISDKSVSGKLAAAAAAAAVRWGGQNLTFLVFLCHRHWRTSTTAPRTASMSRCACCCGIPSRSTG